MIDPRIFRAYDIRGVAHAQLSVDACRLIGRAFGTVLRRLYKKDHPTVAVGRDARTHGPELEQAVIDGLTSTGCKVFKIGPTPSPVNYFTICHQRLDGGVQVTASHNPKDDNGLKLQTREAEAFSGESLQELRRQIEAEDFEKGEGSVEELDAATPYIERLARLFPHVGKNLTVVIDAGNGIAGPVDCEILRRVGATVIELYTKPDGTFPHHAADPSKRETLKELQATVRDEKASVGFGFDGDGDRLGVVDERGDIRSADDVLLLLAKDHLQRHKGKPVVFTVSNSGTLNTEIEQWGGKPIMCKVGHSYVEHAMAEHGSLLGGEQSGHFFCGEDYYGFDDALVAALRILSIMNAERPYVGAPGRSHRSIGALMADFPKVYLAAELRPGCADDSKAAVIASITKHFSKDYPVVTLDGARVDFGDGAWAGIRQSNTSPCLSVCMEARSPEKLKEIQEIVIEHLRSYPEIQLNN